MPDIFCPVTLMLVPKQSHHLAFMFPLVPVFPSFCTKIRSQHPPGSAQERVEKQTRQLGNTLPKNMNGDTRHLC